MVVRFLFFTYLCTTVFSNFAKHHYSYKEVVLLTGGFESKNAFINYVEIDGTRYIVKQKKTSSKQFSVVRDALAAYIAKDLNIAQSVEIIAPKKEFPGKNNIMWPATIHTIAAGKTVREQPESKYYLLRLKQRIPEGVLLTNRWLTETIINQMTWHKQLPIIIALDIFICNTDRHSGNLFYDPKTDCFCAIDMDNIFRRNLPILAAEKLHIMIDGGKIFTKKEIKAFIKMRNTMQFLLDQYSVQNIIDRLHFFVKQAGFTKDSLLYTEKVAHKIARHEKIIIESRASTYELISLLDKIINDFKLRQAMVGKG